MGLGPTGWLEGNTAHIAIACDFIVDFENFFVYMQNFQVVSLGTLTIVMRGNPVIDWLSNLIVNTVCSDLSSVFCDILMYFPATGHTSLQRTHHRIHLNTLPSPFARDSRRDERWSRHGRQEPRANSGDSPKPARAEWIRKAIIVIAFCLVQNPSPPILMHFTLEWNGN